PTLTSIVLIASFFRRLPFLDLRVRPGVQTKEHHKRDEDQAALAKIEQREATKAPYKQLNCGFSVLYND
ncbi:MAG TPA: hypothetical protein VFC66_04155, partial [Anaerolineaceae bacterium]|nr:hypothetical protein [Anaerolineaceae bacterium]